MVHISYQMKNGEVFEGEAFERIIQHVTADKESIAYLQRNKKNKPSQKY